nr:hypothetical protein [uncultured Desulfobulbus sp.]
MSYELRYFNQGFHARFHGEVSIDELNRANGEMQGHFDFDHHRYQLIDFLDATLDSVTEDDAEFPAVTDSVASKTTRLCVKVAFVVTEAYALSLVHSYIQYARLFVPKWKFEVFPRRSSALAWVESG